MQTGSSETLIGWKFGKNHLCPSMGPNGGSVAMDSGRNMKYFPVAAQSLMQTGNWNRTFPLKIQTEKEAILKSPFSSKKTNASVKSLIIFLLCYDMTCISRAQVRDSLLRNLKILSSYSLSPGFQISIRVNLSCWIRIQVFQLHLNFKDFFVYLYKCPSLTFFLI